MSSEVAASQVERLMAEGPLGLAAAGRRMGTYRNNKGVHPSTVLRWITDGVSLPDGRTVKLEAFRIANRWSTSWPALVRFVQDQQQVTTEAVGVPVRAPAERMRAAERAGRELESMGC